jgi:hypothetical protein
MKPCKVRPPSDRQGRGSDSDLIQQSACASGLSIESPTLNKEPAMKYANHIGYSDCSPHRGGLLPLCEGGCMTKFIDAYIKARMGYDAWDLRYGG